MKLKSYNGTYSNYPNMSISTRLDTNPLLTLTDLLKWVFCLIASVTTQLFIVYGRLEFPKSPPKLINIRQIKKINIDLFINDVISINWDRFQLIPNVKDARDSLHSEFTQVIDTHAPWEISKVNGRHLPWISTELISLFKQRDKAWAIYRQRKIMTGNHTGNSEILKERQ